jgi:molecular chaperone GrpE
MTTEDTDAFLSRVLEGMNLADELAAIEKKHREGTTDLLFCLISLMDAVSRLLETADSVDSPTREHAVSWRGSVRVIAKQLQADMTAAGLSRMECVGDSVDPGIHEVIETRPAENCEQGTILAVAAHGYTWNDKLIRRPQVVVSRESEESS